MRRFELTGLILLSVASLVLGGCSDSGSSAANTGRFVAQRPFSREVPVAGHVQLRVRGVNGVVEVRGGAAATRVSISALLKVSSSLSLDDAQMHLGDLDVLVTDAGAEVIVETEQPAGPTAERDYIVEYAIAVPDTMRVDVTNLNGETLIDGIESDDIRAVQANGPIAVDAVLPMNGVIDLGTANGDISLTIPVSTSAVLSCRSATGTVSYSGLIILNPVHTPHSLTGTLGGGDGRITITNANGDIALRGGS